MAIDKINPLGGIDDAAWDLTDAEATAIACLKAIALGGGGGGGSDATAAKQDAQTALLTSIEDEVDGIETLLGSTNTALALLHTDNTGTQNVAFATAPNVKVVDSTSAQLDYNPPVTATLSKLTVAATVASFAIKAANAAAPWQKGISLFNKTTAVVSICFQTTATVADAVVDMQPGDYYEIPQTLTGPHQGIISGIPQTAGATGTINMMVLT